MLNLRFSDPQHKIEMHQQLEETSRMVASFISNKRAMSLSGTDGPPALSDRYGVESRHRPNVTKSTRMTQLRHQPASYVAAAKRGSAPIKVLV
jgi:hypothetical protein